MASEFLNQDDLWRIGQKVKITDGPYIGLEGVIYLIDRKARIVRVKISLYGQTIPTPVELPFSYLKPAE